MPTASNAVGYSYSTSPYPYSYAGENGEAVVSSGGKLFLSKSGTLIPIQVPGFTTQSVSGISPDGVVFGTVTKNPGLSSFQTFPFTFDGNSYRVVTQEYGSLSGGSTTTVLVDGADRNGDVTGTSSGRSGVTTGFSVNKAGSVTSVTPASVGLPYVYLVGVNDAGVDFGSATGFGGSIGTTPRAGFIFANGGYTTILPPGAATSGVVGVNASGLIAGFYTGAGDGVSHGFLDSNGSYFTIDVPGMARTIVAGVNDAGAVFGDSTNDTGPTPQVTQGFLYKDGVYTTIAFPDAVSTHVEAVTDAGDVVGDYTDGNGVVHGFVASLATPPSGTGNNQTYIVGANGSLMVTGSGDTVNATGAGAAVTIGGDGQYASDADDDVVQFGAGGTAAVTDASRVELFGDGVMASIGANDTVGFYGRGGHLTASGAGDHVFVGTNGQFASDADDNFITFAQGGAVSMFNDAREDVFGSGVTVDVGANDTIGLYGSGNTLTASGGGDAVWIGGNGRDAIDAQVDVARFTQGNLIADVVDNSRVLLFGDDINVVTGANVVVDAIGRQVTVDAGGVNDTITISGALGPLSFGSATFHAAGGRLVVADNTGVFMTGDGVAVRLGAGSTVEIDGHDDVVTMSDGGGTVEFGNGGNQIAGAGAGADTFMVERFFSGNDTITGFTAAGAAYDTLAFDHNVFASVSAILQAATQIGADVVITAGPNDVIRLQSVSLAALSSSNLKVT